VLVYFAAFLSSPHILVSVFFSPTEKLYDSSKLLFFFSRVILFVVTGFTYHDIVAMSTFHSYDIGDIVTAAVCGSGNAYPSGAPNFTSDFHRGSCCPVICVSLFYVIVLFFGFLVLIVPFV